MENELTIVLTVSKFKEILIHSWHLLPLDMQQELLSMGIYLKPTVPRT